LFPGNKLSKDMLISGLVSSQSNNYVQYKTASMSAITWRKADNFIGLWLNHIIIYHLTSN